MARMKRHKLEMPTTARVTPENYSEGGKGNFKRNTVDSTYRNDGIHKLPMPMQ